MFKKKDPLYASGTCDAILDTAKTVYNEESERFKQAETKTKIMLAFVGALLGAFLTYLGAFIPITDDNGYLVYTYVSKLIIFICLTISVIYSLRSVKAGQYDQVSLENIVTYDFAKESEEHAKLEIAATYKDVVDLNRERLELKMRFYNIGLKFMFLGFLIFVFHFILEEVIKIVIR